MAGTVVFQAEQISNSSYSPNEVVIFQRITSNAGSGYNSSTGKFTAPVAGLYAFTKQICTGGDAAFTSFVHNVQTVLASMTNPNACSSAQIFVSMTSGDQVWVQTTLNSDLFSNYYRQTNFAGALIHG